MRLILYLKILTYVHLFIRVYRYVSVLTHLRCLINADYKIHYHVHYTMTTETKAKKKKKENILNNSYVTTF